MRSLGMKKSFRAVLLACFALGLFACDNAWFEDVVKAARDGAAKPEVTVVTRGGDEDKDLEDEGAAEEEENLPEEEAGEENPDPPHIGGGEGEYQGIKVVSIKLNVSKFTLPRTTTYRLKATVNPPEAPVRWYSTSNNVATVDQNGLVTMLHTGSTNIVAKAGSKSAVCAVTVQ
jgi:uncharacterized protein YjdB